MKARIATVVLALVLIPTSCKKPGPVDREAPPKKAVPAAGTGTLEQAGDPVEPLHKRTYFLVAEGDLVHAGTTAGIVTWSLENPKKPEKLGSLVLPGSVASLTVLGGETPVLAAATGPTGVALVDTRSADRGEISLLSDGRWASRGGCHAAWKVRDTGSGRVLIACGTAGVAEADVSDPASPRITRVLTTGGYVRDLALIDSTRAVAAAGRSGLIVVEFPPKGKPGIVSTLVIDGDARAIEIADERAYVANGPAGMAVVDMRDPALPVSITRYEPDATDLTRGLALAGHWLYLCMGDSGLLILDITDPAAPGSVGSFDPGRALNRVAVSGDLVLAANDDAGLLVLDVSDPAKPLQIFPVPEK